MIRRIAPGSQLKGPFGSPQVMLPGLLVFPGSRKMVGERFIIARMVGLDGFSDLAMAVHPAGG